MNQPAPTENVAPAPAPAVVQGVASVVPTIDVSGCIIELNKIDATTIVDENAKKEILGKLEPLNKVLQEKMTSLGPKKGWFGFGGKKSKKSKKSKSKTKKQRR
jgi:hypothetical protein